VHTTRFWIHFHQVRPKSKDCKAKQDVARYVMLRIPPLVHLQSFLPVEAEICYENVNGRTNERTD